MLRPLALSSDIERLMLERKAHYVEFMSRNPFTLANGRGNGWWMPPT
jgi:hypothetical protein